MTRRLAAILSLDAVGFTAGMAAAPQATLAAVNALLRDVVRPAAAAEGGRIVKLTGDGALIAFPAAGAALAAAARIQTEAAEAPLRLRAGIHAGDVIERDGDLFGDAVNLAVRLQAEAAPGGVMISRLVADLAGPVPGVALRPEGPRRLRGAAAPIDTLSIDPDGGAAEARRARLARAQEVRFAAAPDGTRLAWTAIGQGRTLVKAPNWIHHLELDWEVPWSAALLDALAARGRLIRFDARGNGLSDRDPPGYSLDLFADDLGAVWDAAGADRAPIVAVSQGCAVAVAHAVRRPGQVSGLVLIGGFAQGRARRSADEAAAARAVQAMIAAGWTEPPPSVRDLFALTILPDAAREDRLRAADLMREMISAEAFAATRAATDAFDVTDLLAQVRCPTLVLHCRHDRLQPIEQGRRLAAGIAGARFVTLPSRNHVLVDYDPAWPLALHEIDAFLAALT